MSYSLGKGDYLCAACRVDMYVDPEDVLCKDCKPDCPSCAAHVAREKELLEKVFPMQDGPPIPWMLAEKIYAGYVAVFGGDQSLQRIADRGGFGWGEVADMWRNLSTRDRFRAALDALKEGK